jgi:DNA polymerase-3 subunit beta
MASFTVNSTEFLDAISAIYPIIPNKPPRDILKCFKVEAKQGATDTLSIHATDLETFASITLDGSIIVNQAGEFVVPATILLDYARSLDGGNATFLVTPQEALQIVEGEAEFEVGLQDIDEYPDFPDPPADLSWATLPLPALGKALNQVIFAVADKGSPRWGTLNAVCLETDGQVVNLIGTDQHRASVVSMEVADTLLNSSYLVPSKTLALIPKIFTTDEVRVSFGSNHNLIFSDGATTVLVRLMHGNYPPVKDFVPDHPNSIDIDAAGFLRQVKKSSLATDKHSTLRLELGADKIKLSAKTRQQRKVAKVEFPLEYDGETFQFALNCKYLIDMLKASSNSQPLKMHFNQSNQPILFSQDSFRHLIVPQVI